MVRELLSIVVTTYNRDDALAAVLRSLAGQTDPDFEVIVADDGSRPSTALLVETWMVGWGNGWSMSGTRTTAFAPPKSAIGRCC